MYQSSQKNVFLIIESMTKYLELKKIRTEINL